MIVLRIYTDHELITALKKGSEDAFNELFRRHWQNAFDAAYRKVGSKELAEEIVQDIFMDLWNKRESLSILSFKQYLAASVKYQALNKIRSRIVHEKYWDYCKAFIPQSDNTTEKTVHYQELKTVIDQRLDMLPKKTKAIFCMNRFEGKSLKEIAQLLKLSEKTIEYHLNRSLKDLKLYLRNTFLFVSIPGLMLLIA